MRTFCRRHGVRPYRPTYRYLRGDPERQAAARAELAGLAGLKKTGTAKSAAPLRA
jgi:hypothetical protein